MTRLDKRVRRVVDGVGRTKGIVVALYPGGTIGLRELKRRKEYFISVSLAYQIAVQREVDSTRAAKRTAKGGKTKVSRGLLTTGRRSL